MTKRHDWLRLILALGLLLLPLTLLRPAAPVTGAAATGIPTMQQVDAPARVARVAEVPGASGREAWGIGFISTPVSGWRTSDYGGQLVFLHYAPDPGWQVDGPPRSTDGTVINPKLSSLALAAGGEGWAVGDATTLIHHLPGSGWIQVPAGGLPAVNLEGLTIQQTSSGVQGFAVGEKLTVLRLASGGWSVDQASSATSGADLAAVSMRSPTDAWAVSGTNSSALVIQHRTAAGWATVSSGEPMFDAPPAPTQSRGGSTLNQSAVGSSVAVTQSGVWFAGKIFPVDPYHPYGDEVVGDQARPFTMYYDGSSWQSYCPALRNVSSNGQTSSTFVCDHSFPLSGYDISSLAAFPDHPGDEAYAGGMGLDHFVHRGCPADDPGGCWVRMPDSDGYLISLSMADPGEGWTATMGGSIGAGGDAHSNAISLGHITLSPAIPHMARWPSYAQQPLESVALARDGSGYALAVGGQGTTAIFTPGTGWDTLARVAIGALHSVSWPAFNSGWAVGAGGTIAHFDGTDFTYDSQAVKMGRHSLFGVAFTDSVRGWAVGEAGTILDHTAAGWAHDPQYGSATTSALYAVAALPGGAIAVGAGGTVLELTNGAWSPDAGARALAVDSAGKLVNLYGVTTLDDGTVVIAGAGGTLLTGRLGGPWSRVTPAIEGNLTSVGAGRDSNGFLHLVVSISSHSANKFAGDLPGTTGGWAFGLDRTGWHDLGLSHRQTLWTVTDTAAPADPVYGVALEPGGTTGWAVGGFPANLLDDDSQAYQQASTSSSVYRVDLVGDPRPASQGLQPPSLPAGSVSFAFLGDSSCAAGICGSAFGSGIKADTIFTAAEQEINFASKSVSGPILTMFGGNMRRTGLPEELNVFKELLGGLQVPFYAALGDQDLASNVDTGQVKPQQATQGLGGGIPALPAPSGGTPGFYLNTFNDQAAPWGHGQVPPGFASPSFSGGGVGTDDPTLAHSHYVLDYAPAGKPIARFVVLDDSQGSVAASGIQQNPSDDESQFLTSALADAKLKNLPAFVFLNMPTADPTNPASTTTSDPSVNTAVQAGATALFAAHMGVNAQCTLASTGCLPFGQSAAGIPLFVSGTAGSPLDGTRLPQHGYYYSWLMVTLDKSQHVSVRSFPVLESVAMHSVDGIRVHAGGALRIVGRGRLPDGGQGNANGGNPDPTQSLANYIDIPYRYSNCDLSQPPHRAFCDEPFAIKPDYHFYSEDPTRAQFVAPCPSISNAYRPCMDLKGGFVPDDQSGYLCTFHPGKVFIDLVTGVHRSREEINVGAGSGICQAAYQTVPPVPPVISVVAPQVVGKPVIQPVPEPLRHFFRPPPINLTPAVVPPPPVPVVAPAPPPAAGAAKKEKKEVVKETAGEGGGESARRPGVVPKTEGESDQMLAATVNGRWDVYSNGWALAGSALVLALALAAAVGLSRPAAEARREHARWGDSRWE